jgi:hypothetical protein
VVRIQPDKVTAAMTTAMTALAPRIGKSLASSEMSLEQLNPIRGFVVKKT